VNRNRIELWNLCQYPALLSRLWGEFYTGKNTLNLGLVSQTGFRLSLSSIWTFKGIVHLKKSCHHLLTLMLFQACMNFLLLLNTKEDILKVFGNQDPIDYHSRKHNTTTIPLSGYWHSSKGLQKAALLELSSASVSGLNGFVNLCLSEMPWAIWPFTSWIRWRSWWSKTLRERTLNSSARYDQQIQHCLQHFILRWPWHYIYATNPKPYLV